MAQPKDKKQETVGPEDLPVEERGDAAQDAVNDQAEAEARKAQEQAQEQARSEQGGGRSFPRERILNESEVILGVPAHVVAGALADDDRENLTVDGARNAVERWLSRDVTEE